MSDGEGSNIWIWGNGIFHVGVDGHPSEISIQMAVDAQIVED